MVLMRASLTNLLDSSLPPIRTLLWQRGQHMAALERIKKRSNDDIHGDNDKEPQDAMVGCF